MNNNKDPRVRRTRQILKQALIDIIKQKGYRNVTVTDIVELSDVNRATFYAHFINKDDLMETLINEKLDGLEDALYKPLKKLGKMEFEKLSPATDKLFGYVLNHADFFDLLLENEDILNLENRIINIARDVFLNKVRFISARNENVNSKSFQTFRAYGTYGLIIDWIEDGYARSPNEMAEKLYAILKSHSPIVMDKLTVKESS